MAKSINFVKEGGRVDLQQGRLDTLFASLRNGEYVLTVTQRREHRSLSQNALMWLWLKCIAEETGNDEKALYNHFCGRFLAYTDETFGDGITCCRTSSQLDTAQFSAFLDKIQGFAATELGITLPDPEDRNFECFYQSYK